MNLSVQERVDACASRKEPCVLGLQSKESAYAVAASMRASARHHGCSPPRDSVRTNATILYVLLANPFAGERCCYGRGARPRGHVPEDMVLRLHLEALATLPSRLAALRILLPRDPQQQQTKQRQSKGYLDVEREAARLPFPADLELLPNNSLGSYGMYLHAFAATRERFVWYIFCEDDYLPAPAHFDSLLVRMHSDAFGRGADGLPAHGCLAGVLQGRPVEPASPFPLHLESSHIMPSSSLARLFERAGGARSSMGVRMQQLTEAQFGPASAFPMTYFGRVQLGFGQLLLDANISVRDWTAAYRAPYWDHWSIVDWTGPMHAFAVPYERVLFVPVQWWFERELKMCCRAVDCDTIRSHADVCCHTLCHHVPPHAIALQHIPPHSTIFHHLPPGVSRAAPPVGAGHVLPATPSTGARRRGAARTVEPASRGRPGPLSQ